MEENKDIIEEDAGILETPEILQLARRVKENTEVLLEKHYQDNVETLRQAIAWKQSAEKDIVARGALYTLMAKQGDKDDSPEVRAEAISESIILWAEITGYVISPKTKIRHLPLILFPFQKRLIRELVLAIETGYDSMIEKSREMGVSWLVLYVFFWYWLFKPGSNFSVGSYKEKLVTDGTVDSMFGKLDYIIQNQPKWLLPKGFKKKIHFTKSRLVNPHMESYITGDTMNADFGRGARKTAIFFDELAMWDYARAAWESSSETTDCRIGNSTPNGYNYYKQLIDSGLHTTRLHWRENPLKDDLWYKYKKMKDTPEAVAREIDISYDSSRVGVIYNEWKKKTVKGAFSYDPHLPLYVGWDFGRGDGTAIIWVQIREGRAVVIDAYYKRNVKLMDFFAPLVTGRMLTEYQYQYDEKELDMIERHSKWKPAVHFGDPAGNQKIQNQDYSVIETLGIYGIKVNVNYQKINHQARQSDTQRLIMRGVDFNDGDDTDRTNMDWLDISMLNYSLMSTNIEGKSVVKANAKPKHDEYSHMATAFEYLSVGLSDMKSTKVGGSGRVADKFKGSATGLGKRNLIY